MIQSSIDIGTNSVLLLIADVDGNQITVLDEKQQIPRLGRGVDKDGLLSDESQDRVIDVLHEYQKYIAEYSASAINDTIVTATSAVRDASNRESFMRRVYDETGWEVRLLSGGEEAQTTYRGALAILNTNSSDTKTAVLDIGGGSTEIALGEGKKLERWISLNMGSVRFTERFLVSDPPEDHQLNATRKGVRELLDDWSGSSSNINRVVGVAGTVTSIAGIYLELAEYDAAKINGTTLTSEVIDDVIDELSSLTHQQIEGTYPVFLKGRGDVITAGLIVLSEFLKWAGVKEIVVSTGGIRHGVLITNHI